MTETNTSGPVQTGRNPQYEKAQVRQVLMTPAFKRLPVRRYEIGGKGKNRSIKVFTVKPTAFTDDLKDRFASALKEKMGKEITVDIVAESFAMAKNVHRTPLKVRHVLQLVRGKRVDEAINILKFTPNYAATDILKVVESAAANANMGWGADAEELVISECYADHGLRMKRYRPGPMGRARPIQKMLSHISVVLQDAEAGR